MKPPDSTPEEKTRFVGPKEAVAPATPHIPDHQLLRCIGQGSYGEVWLAKSALGAWRAVKVVYRRSFDDDRPYEREFEGIQKYEPISRAHDRATGWTSPNCRPTLPSCRILTGRSDSMKLDGGGLK